MSQPDPRAAILRAAGHEDAAQLLESLSALDTPKPTPPPEQPQQPATMTPEEARRREGEALLEAMNRDLGRGGAEVSA